MTTAQSPVQLRDPAMMRALAHPARLAIVRELSRGRSATATECARIVGLSPSATSYHLRALAKAGLVREAPGRGDGRERVWTSAFSDYVIAADQAPEPEVRAAEDKFMEAYLLLHDERVRQFMAHREDEAPEWYAVAGFSESVLELTAQELGELYERLQELLRPYREGEREKLPEGSRQVSVTIRAFPLPRRDMKN